MTNQEINALTDEELDALVKAGKCPYEPQQHIGQPIGMYHCPVCGEMVVAGFPHVQTFDMLGNPDENS